MANLTNELPLEIEQPPLRVDEQGVVRVGNSRVTLDLVVEQYENGMTPEDMVGVYGVLNLADVYDVLAYYLRHRDEVRAYLERRQQGARELQARIEADRAPISRQELLARTTAAVNNNAPAGH